jgi:glutaminase
VTPQQCGTLTSVVAGCLVVESEVYGRTVCKRIKRAVDVVAFFMDKRLITYVEQLSHKSPLRFRVEEQDRLAGYCPFL